MRREEKERGEVLFLSLSSKSISHSLHSIEKERGERESQLSLMLNVFCVGGQGQGIAFIKEEGKSVAIVFFFAYPRRRLSLREGENQIFFGCRCSAAVVGGGGGQKNLTTIGRPAQPHG